MKQKIRFYIFCLILILFVTFSPNYLKAQKSPLTVAESSNFKTTSTYADVISFIEKLQLESPLIKTETLCYSSEGREVPLLIIGDPVPSSPLDLNHDNRGVIYIQANIHAGEVEGKESMLMLARDIIQDKNRPYLDKLVILITPIFNADGNEKISPNNRRSQVGPENGVGLRYNGQNLDLNRDGMKMESPEMAGLVQNVLLRWDPFLLVDCHTTNGSYHEEPVTYSWSLNPNGDKSILELMRDRMMPAIQKGLKDKYNTLAIPYGNFMGREEPNGWRTFSHQPRYITNYIGLRNRLGILIENYSYADFKTRVYGNYNYVKAILDYCYTQKDELVGMVQEADKKTVRRGTNPSPGDSLAVEVEVKALKTPVTILGWETEPYTTESGRTRRRRTDRKKTFTLPNYSDFVPKRQVRFPFGYLISLPVPAVLDKLVQHGITVEKLTRSVKLNVETFKIEEITSAERLNQGHHTNSIKGNYVTEEIEFPKGTLFIPSAQQLANLASGLLEPESDDGLFVWNFFDRFLARQWGRGGVMNYPVYRLLEPVNLVKKTIK